MEAKDAPGGTSRYLCFLLIALLFGSVACYVDPEFTFPSLAMRRNLRPSIELPKCRSKEAILNLTESTYMDVIVQPAVHLGLNPELNITENFPEVCVVGKDAEAGRLADIEDYVSAFPSVKVIQKPGDGRKYSGCKLCIHISSGTVYYDFMPWCRYNAIMVNVEWISRNNLLDRFDFIIVKTRHTQKLLHQYFYERKKRQPSYRVPVMIYSKHTSTNAEPMRKNDYGIVGHYAGQSPYKGTLLAIKAWMNMKERPKCKWFIITCFRSCAEKLEPWNEYEQFSDVYQGAQRRVFPTLRMIIYTQKLPKKLYHILQETTGYFICPSTIEGYGMYIDEARSRGGVILTTNNQPMNELVDSSSGFLSRIGRFMGFNSAMSIFGSKRYQLYAEAELKSLTWKMQQMFEISEDDLDQIGLNARRKWLDDSKYFYERFQEVLEDVRWGIHAKNDGFEVVKGNKLQVHDMILNGGELRTDSGCLLTMNEGQLRLFNQTGVKLWQTPQLESANNPMFMLLPNGIAAIIDSDKKIYWESGGGGGRIVLTDRCRLILEDASGSHWLDGGKVIWSRPIRNPSISFRKLENTDCPNNDIGKCGIFQSQKEIENKCRIHPNCMGYTMSREEGKIKDESIKNSNGMYPWCLKSCVSTNTPGSMPLSDFYMKMEDTPPFESRFKKRAGSDLVGGNLGALGSFRTQTGIEDACIANSDCIGYTMANNQNKEARVNADGMYACVMKSKSAQALKKDLTHNLYLKDPKLVADDDTRKWIKTLLLTHRIPT